MVAPQVDEEAIFDVARRIESPEARADYLQQVCGDDTAMLSRVQALLRVHDSQPEFLEGVPSSVLRTVGSPTPTERKGTVIGPYKLREQIGEGGFGVVYVAQQEKPVHRKVALKIIKPGMDTKDVIARFEAERQALALMDHPNVARVLDAGATDNGRPYFVMELVHGVPITEFCDKNNLSNRQRLDLFVDVCHAIHHAHQKGIIHRDLKPSNIMVTLHDGKPVPKVIDFGVSKALSQQLTEKSIYTSYGQMIGTPVYMSPEQAEMSGLGIDTRSDIYSLGVLLYELLTGKTPLDSERLRASAYAEMIRMIREDEPPRPSTRVSTMGEEATIIAQHRSTDAKKLCQNLRGELDWIVMKALDKDRNRRYDSANNFAADVERFLNNEAVEACPTSIGYRVGKFIRRHRGPVTAASALLLVLCLGLAGTSLGLVWARREATRARLAENDATHQRDSAIDARRAEAKAREETRQLLYTSDMDRAQQAWEENNVGLVVELLERHRDFKREGDFEWYYLWRLCRRSLLTPTIKTDSPVDSIAFSPDGILLAFGGMDGNVVLVNNKTQRKKYFKGHTSQVRALAFSPDGQTIASGSGDRTVRIWNVADTRQIQLIDDYKDWIGSVTFSPDGKWLATASLDGKVSLWDVSKRDFKWRSDDARYVHDVAFSPDGKTLASVSNGIAKSGISPGTKLRDVETGKVLNVFGEFGDQTPSVQFSPDGNSLATACNDGLVRIWNKKTGTMRELQGHTSGVSSVAWMDDNTLASGSSDNTVRLWDVSTGVELDRLKGHSGAVRGVVVSPQGTTLVSGSKDHTVKLWDVTWGSETNVLTGHEAGIGPVVFSPDGILVVSGGGDGTIKLWDVRTGQVKLDLLGHSEGVKCLAFSPDGETLASGGDDRNIVVWDTTTGKVRRTLSGHTDTVWSMEFFDDGLSLVSVGEDGAVRLWSVATGGQRMLVQCSNKIGSVAVWNDEMLAFGGWDDYIVELWDLKKGQHRRTLEGHLGSIRGIAYSSTGRQLATASYDGTVRLWDLRSNSESEIVARHAGTAECVRFSPDGVTLASAGSTGVVKLLDLKTRKERATLKGHMSAVNSLAFSHNGKTLATAGLDRTVRLWRAASDEDVLAVGFD